MRPGQARERLSAAVVRAGPFRQPAGRPPWRAIHDDHQPVVSARRLQPANTDLAYSVGAFRFARQKIEKPAFRKQEHRTWALVPCSRINGGRRASKEHHAASVQAATDGNDAIGVHTVLHSLCETLKESRAAFRSFRQ